MANREVQKERKAAKAAKAALALRTAPIPPSVPIWKLGLNTTDAVYLAICRKAKDQKSIRDLTKLRSDEITDALADLYADNKLDRKMLRQRVYVPSDTQTFAVAA